MFSKYIHIVLLLGILSCKKAEPPLPDAVVGGDNVFACHINGKSFIAHDHADLFGSSSKAVEGGLWAVFEPYYRIDNFWLTGSSDKQTMDLYISFCDSVGRYPLVYTVNCPRPTCTPMGNYSSYQRSFMTSSTNQGVINITYLDSAANELCGTFYFKAASKSGETITVTDGRFHYKFPRP